MAIKNRSYAGSRNIISNNSIKISFNINIGIIIRPMSVSTIGGGGDTTILSPGRSPEQPLPGIGLHDPLHGRQACPKPNSFLGGVGQISPRKGLF